MSVKCPKCQFDNPDTQKLCGECGNQLTSTKEPDVSFNRTLETLVDDLPRGTLFAERYVYDFRNIGNIFVGGLADKLQSWHAFVQGLARFLVIWLILYWLYRKKIFIKI